MSNGQEREAEVSDEDNNTAQQYASESDNSTSKPVARRNKAKVHGHRAVERPQYQPEIVPAPNNNPANNQVAQQQGGSAEENGGYRPGVLRQSRIKDRPPTKDATNSAVKIKIELDLEVEVDLYARVKGDVTIGLM